ncbi:hypothetical protein HOI26_04920 [Candidatus Woesearchaeota archaeon]|jgi:hypothetical protein|nr:hypothetical protein [Candidatus Woesearchaeota archaeon]MBT5740413.1 hypothetical protein [Candidatus Woesearchaeota archaeon]
MISPHEAMELHERARDLLVLGKKPEPINGDYGSNEFQTAKEALYEAATIAYETSPDKRTYLARLASAAGALEESRGPAEIAGFAIFNAIAEYVLEHPNNKEVDALRDNSATLRTALKLEALIDIIK